LGDSGNEKHRKHCKKSDGLLHENASSGTNSWSSARTWDNTW
jgi:hypothetical protein